MNLYGIGIDVVEVARIESSLQEFGSRFREKVFTAAEREYCEKQKRPAIHFAARFAAKEAIAKAFGTGIGKNLGLLDIEILRKPSGEPTVVLSGAGQQFAENQNITEIKISLTHADHYAAANAVVLAAEKN
ncbi:holo-ACP synthase [Persicirhabdus sediminis]|uniref:Holo-[acyl-carrier-protein] synthase n=1 Tax=Persicirhabdus sediminis TaxID=454144 RepID=A0A8J7SI76_9BACT|nr:holo-ACP synthase [Persicirhabdus sediminis]MBK1791280.1 holo-ACP synthase [Persicirhabdus sediminis]